MQLAGLLDGLAAVHGFTAHVPLLVSIELSLDGCVATTLVLGYLTYERGDAHGRDAIGKYGRNTAMGLAAVDH